MAAAGGDACTTTVPRIGRQTPDVPPDSARAKVSKRLDKRLRVTLTDGRMVVGTFSCFDKQRNILLTETKELRSGSKPDELKPELERHLGIVLVPRKHYVAVQALGQ